MTNALHRSVIALCLALGVNSLWAQGGLHDPMRPPDKISLAAPVTAVTGAVAEVPSAESSGAPANNIQMLVIGRQRAFAMIDGVLVKPGESVNQWQLVSISRQSVVMRNATVTQEINLNPAVVKTVRSTNRKSSSHDSVDNKLPRNSP